MLANAKLSKVARCRKRGIDLSLSKTQSLYGIEIPMALMTIASLILTVGGTSGCPGDDDRISRDMDSEHGEQYRRYPAKQQRCVVGMVGHRSFIVRARPRAGAVMDE